MFKRDGDLKSSSIDPISGMLNLTISNQNSNSKLINKFEDFYAKNQRVQACDTKNVYFTFNWLKIV